MSAKKENADQKDWFWLTGRSVTSPRPHETRPGAARAVGVVIQRAPPTVQFNRDSLLSDSEHIYNEIADDEEQG